MFGWLFGKKNNPPVAQTPPGGTPPTTPTPPTPAGQTLSDIVRGIAHAVEAANEIGDISNLNQLQTFFTRNDDGTVTAKTVRIKIDDTHYMDVPLIGLVNPSTMELEETEVRMCVRMTNTEIKEHLHTASETMKVQRASFNVALTSVKPGESKDVIDVTMKFKKAAPQEVMARAIDELARQARVQKLPPPTTP
jgi:hypothetical protein